MGWRTEENGGTFLSIVSVAVRIGADIALLCAFAKSRGMR